MAALWGIVHRAGLLLILAIAGGLTPHAAEAGENCTLARVVSVQGRVEVRAAGQSAWLPVKLEDGLCAGDTLRVAVHSRAALRLQNQSVARLDQNTTLTLADPQDEKKSALMELIHGAIHVLTRTTRPFRVKTPFMNANIEGTEFFVGLSPAGATLVVYEGNVSASNEQGSVMLAGGETVSAEKNQAPRKSLILKPLDAVQWAIYYPALGVPGRTQELLSLGRADEAGREIEAALKRNPRDANAQALASIIALAQNDKARAQTLAQQAVENDSASSAAKIALSYAQQAHFKIDEATTSMQQVVAQYPDNALAWARLAELQLSAGELEAALKTAQRASELNPALAKTQTVLGFAHLSRIDIVTAKAAFERAIPLDQADPMPRLGLGLTLIRQGQLEEGRAQIEIAAGLDPANSLIRSYLGKAYFEEKRDALAATQYELAKARDPMDPTPWFYDAIRKQTENRPVEALQDLEQSIKLNDNRAVYRSQLLLDSDEAVRGTSLARIYNDLGFEQVAVQEAAKSLSADPTNHSAHRFLSDAYANIPRHDIARVSQLLQSQLLQPINTNPVQPHLAFTDLNIIARAGPAEAAFNEFTPVFERNGPQINISGMAGNNDTLSDELVFSGVHDRLSYSIGQFFYKTDGFRENNDLEHKIYNAFIQYALTPQLNVQMEVRSRRTDQGDLVMNFNPEPTQNRRELEEDAIRLGMRFSPSAQDDFLISYFNARRTHEVLTEGVGINRRVHDDEEGYQLEGQYLFRGSNLNLTVGAGTYSIDVDNKVDLEFQSGVPCTFVLPPSFCHVASESERKRSNGYVYTDIRFPAEIVWTIGLSYDSYEDDVTDTDEVNPKLGLQWNISDSLRLRAAHFETLKPALIADQSIEPTQIAGFNQMFDDPNGTWARRTGIGLDVKLAQGMSGGIEWSERDIKVPLTATNSNDQEEQLARAYFYWAFAKEWALSIDAEYEQLSRDQITVQSLTDIDTYSLPIGLSYFHPGGFFSNLIGTYVHQKVDRVPVSDPAEGDDSFFLVDVSIGYRLPRRQGMVGLDVKNLFDEEFFYRDQNFVESEPSNPRFIPDRTVLLWFMLNF